ncbi:PEP-CTERM sorting domain-containing protein [Roseiterribacter gracilis]|uniref:Ice-binding protein C-terminal domain-containing protein n=1 Tax=Roseiterribacter gracilis TaxID=2812848 RepID=A0A8S8XFT3_9PROT|nr:hypothetical protein TMPK1_25440 [Rhodospirillales bacterium TMPK1]
MSNLAKRGSALLWTLAVISCATPALAGVHVTSIAGGGNPNGLSSTRAGVTTQDFNDATVGGLFRQGSGASFTAPLGDTSIYLSLNPDNSPIPLFFNASNYFGLYWGSIDDFNQISFFRQGQTVARFSGNDIWNRANGDTAPDLNRFVEFVFDGGTTFDEVHLISPGVSFEIDNIATGLLASPNVPEPASLLLLGSALFGLGALRRRQR